MSCRREQARKEPGHIFCVDSATSYQDFGKTLLLILIPEAEEGKNGARVGSRQALAENTV